MNGIDFLVIGLIVAALAAAIWLQRRGKAGCGNNSRPCGSCPYRGGCLKERTKGTTDGSA